MSEFKPQPHRPQQSCDQPSGHAPMLDSEDAPPMAYPVYPQGYSTRPVQPSIVYHSIPLAANAPYGNQEPALNLYWILFILGFACPILFAFGIGGLCCPRTLSERRAGTANLIASAVVSAVLFWHLSSLTWLASIGWTD